MSDVIFMGPYEKKEKRRLKKEYSGTDRDKDTDMDTDKDTDTDRDSDMKLANFCLVSIWHYSPWSAVWMSNVISMCKSQQHFELVAPFSYVNGDMKIHSAIGTAL